MLVGMLCNSVGLPLVLLWVASVSLLLGRKTTWGAAIISSSPRCSGDIGGIRIIPSSAVDCGGAKEGEEEEAEVVVGRKRESDNVVVGSVLVEVATTINGAAGDGCGYVSSFLLNPPEVDSRSASLIKLKICLDIYSNAVSCASPRRLRTPRPPLWESRPVNHPRYERRRCS